MNHKTQKLFFIPVGLPGMGKTTFSKRLQMHLRNLLLINTYKRISYDEMLIKNQQDYQQLHPNEPFHEVIDIIRPQADLEYLQTIRDSTCQPGVYFLDRNNTPDLWPSLSACIRHNGFSVLLTPQQPLSFCPFIYRVPNPISPQLFYHCAKRIFSRSKHDCLSGQDKFKAIEVLLRFTKLYDNHHHQYHNYNGEEQQNNKFNYLDQKGKKMFDGQITLSFEVENIEIDQGIQQAIVKGVNQANGQFGQEIDKKVIQQVIEACDAQIQRDLQTNQRTENQKYNSIQKNQQQRVNNSEELYDCNDQYYQKQPIKQNDLLKLQQHLLQQQQPFISSQL